MQYTNMWLTDNSSGVSVSLVSGEAAGIQVQPGASGFGLPPIEVQSQGGTGDGASFRGQRNAPRDFDLSLWITGTNPSDLANRVNQLTAILNSSNLSLWVTANSGKMWAIRVNRVGGGEVALGDPHSSPSPNELVISVTLRALDPWWGAAHHTETWYQVGDRAPDIVPHHYSGVSHDGEIRHWGRTDFTVSVLGPTAGFKIINPLNPNERVVYDGFVREGQRILVDMPNGTVTDTLTGKGAYHNVQVGSKFFDLPPNSPKPIIQMCNLGPKWDAQVNEYLAAYNYFEDPVFGSNATSNYTNDNGKTIWLLPPQAGHGGIHDNHLWWYGQNYANHSGEVLMAIAYVHGLTPGKWYDLTYYVGHYETPDNHFNPLTFEPRRPRISLGAWTEGMIWAEAEIMGTGWTTLKFRATRDNGVLAFYPGGSRWSDAAGTHFRQWFIGFQHVGVYDEGVGEEWPFSGANSSDETAWYGWTGTPHKSRSIRYILNYPYVWDAGATVYSQQRTLVAA